MIAKIIQILHLLLIITIFISIFIPIDLVINNYQFGYNIKIYVLIFLLFLLAQYLTGYQRCGLTEWEYRFKKEKYKEGFLYRLIKPVITIPENYFRKYLIVLHLLWIAILVYQLKFIKNW